MFCVCVILFSLLSFCLFSFSSFIVFYFFIFVFLKQEWLFFHGESVRRGIATPYILQLNTLTSTKTL